MEKQAYKKNSHIDKSRRITVVIDSLCKQQFNFQSGFWVFKQMDVV